jgi:hypothetical protein
MSIKVHTICNRTLIVKGYGPHNVEPCTGYYQSTKLLHHPTIYPISNKPLPEEKTHWELPAFFRIVGAFHGIPMIDFAKSIIFWDTTPCVLLNTTNMAE